MISEGNSWERKVDHRLRALLERTKGKVDWMHREVNVAVRFSGSIDSLSPYGLKVRAVAGDIATASIFLDEIAKAASAPEILFIELSRPLAFDHSSI
jgi:hypothetical protein